MAPQPITDRDGRQFMVCKDESGGYRLESKQYSPCFVLSKSKDYFILGKKRIEIFIANFKFTSKNTIQVLLLIAVDSLSGAFEPRYLAIDFSSVN